MCLKDLCAEIDMADKKIHNKNYSLHVIFLTEIEFQYYTASIRQYTNIINL